MLQFDEYKVKLNNLRPELDELDQALGLETAIREVEMLESESASDGFWDNLEKAQKVQQRVKQLRDKIEGQQRRKTQWDDLMTLCELGNEAEDETLVPEVEEGFAKLEAEIEEAKLSTLLTGEYDGSNAILTFHAGAGGTEAQDWAQMLFRMYTRWAERHGYKCKVLDYLSGEEGGVKSASILIEGENAYGFLKSEAGVHRLVRISPFDSSGRRHTSFASLEVMPEITDEDNEIVINDADLKIDTYRSGGAGGQHVNKTESAIRITHIPTGVVVACQNERSQHQNREVAMKMLKSKLIEIKERAHLERIEDIKGEQKDIGFGNQIRSYVFMPYTLVKDHRTGFESGNITAVMDGDIDGFINAYLKAESLGHLLENE